MPSNSDVLLRIVKSMAFHQQAADQLRRNLLSSAGEEGLGEMGWECWEGLGGYGSSSVHSLTVVGLILLTESVLGTNLCLKRL